MLLLYMDARLKVKERLTSNITSLLFSITYTADANLK